MDGGVHPKKRREQEELSNAKRMSGEGWDGLISAWGLWQLGEMFFLVG